MQKRSCFNLLAMLMAILPASGATIEANTWYHVIIANSVSATNGANSVPLDFTLIHSPARGLSISYPPAPFK